MSTFKEIETLAGDLVISSKEYQEKRNEWKDTLAKKRQTLSGDTNSFSIKSQYDIEKMNGLLGGFDRRIKDCENWFESYNDNFSNLIELLVCENRLYQYSQDFGITRKGKTIETLNNDIYPIYPPLDFNEIH